MESADSAFIFTLALDWSEGNNKLTAAGIHELVLAAIASGAQISYNAGSVDECVQVLRECLARHEEDVPDIGFLLTATDYGKTGP